MHIERKQHFDYYGYTRIAHRQVAILMQCKYRNRTFRSCFSESSTIYPRNLEMQCEHSRFHLLEFLFSEAAAVDFSANGASSRGTYNSTS